MTYVVCLKRLFQVQFQTIYYNTTVTPLWFQPQFCHIMSIIKGRQILSEIDTKSTIFFIQKYSLAVILKHGTTLGFPNAGPCNRMLLTIAKICSDYENGTRKDFCATAVQIK